MTDTWNVHSLALATTAGVFYILCVIFDALFPPHEVSPWIAWKVASTGVGIARRL